LCDLICNLKDFNYIYLLILIFFKTAKQFIRMQQNNSLDKLKIGEIVKIHSIQTSDIPAKFYELGFYPGSVIEIKHKAPFDGPICVNILENNSLIAVRVSEAKLIITEII